MKTFIKHKNLLALLFCLPLAFVEYQYSYQKLDICRSLGISIPRVLIILPWFGAAICFFVLTIKSASEHDVALPSSLAKKYNAIIGRLLILAAIIGVVNLWPYYYFNEHIDSVSVMNNKINAYDIVERYHEEIEPLLHFRTLAYFSSDKPNVITVYFERGVGRSDNVNKLLNEKL